MTEYHILTFILNVSGMTTVRRGSWKMFFPSIRYYTKESKVWNGLRRLKGQETHPLTLVIEQGNSLEDQANAFSEHFEHGSSFIQYSK